MGKHYSQEDIDTAIDEIIAELDKMGDVARTNELAPKSDAKENVADASFWRGWYRGERMAYHAAIRVVRDMFIKLTEGTDECPT